MARFQTLPEANALNPGANLWILPDSKASNWTLKINWYSNFQFLKASKKKNLKMSADLKKLIDDYHCDQISIKTDKTAPLMVATNSFLPNNQTVLIPYTDEPRSWAIKCHYIWKKLGSPSLRLFLPKQISASSLNSLWPQQDPLNEETLSAVNSSE